MCVFCVWAFFVLFCFIFALSHFSTIAVLGSHKSNPEWWLVRSSGFVLSLDTEVPWPGVELEERERPENVRPRRRGQQVGKVKARVRSQSFLERNLKSEC